MRIVVELALDGALARSEEKDVAPPSDDLVATMTEWWTTHVLEPFLASPAGGRRGPMDVTMPLLGTPVTFAVRFDENHLADLVEAYAVHGWPAVETIERLVVEGGAALAPTLRLVRATRNVLAALVADSMRRIETAAVAYARASWTAARAVVEAELAKFSVLTRHPDKPWFVDRDLARRLVHQCHGYALLHREVVALQKKIDKRNRVVPPSRRVKGSGADLWFELYATPQRELLRKMSEQMTLVTTTFPAAALVLDHLPAEVMDVHDLMRRELAVNALAAAIHGRLRKLATDLDGLLETVDRPHATDVLAPDLDALRAGDFERLRPDRGPSAGVPEQRVMDAVMGRGEKDLRVLADLELLIALHNDGDDDDTDEAADGDGGLDGLDAAVLLKYVDRLSDERDRRRAREERWDTFWNVLEWIGAAVGLILVLVTPGVRESLGPSLLSALAIAGTASAVIGVVLLVVHQIMGALQEAGQLDQSTRDQLYRLGQNDPDALRDIGEALGRSRELREAALGGALVSVLTLGAAHKIKLVGAALTLMGVVDDLETVVRPLEQGDAEPIGAGPGGGTAP